MTGASDDEAVAGRVAGAAGGVSLAGRLSLPGLAVLLRRSALLVTNDSGPAHIAYAVGAPSVTIFGTSSPAQWGPLDRRRHAVVVAEDACHPCGASLCIRRIPGDPSSTR